MEEISLMSSRILLMCAFGVDCSDTMIDFWEDGVKLQKSVSFSLRTTFGNLLNRVYSPHVLLFPFLGRYYLTSYERDQAANAKLLRDFCEKIINDRKEAIKKDPKVAD